MSSHIIRAWSWAFSLSLITPSPGSKMVERTETSDQDSRKTTTAEVYAEVLFCKKVRKMWARRNDIMGALIIMVLLVMVLMMQGTCGIRFVVEGEECFSHNVEYEGDTLHLSFVVIKAESPWHFADEGVDLLIQGPSGEYIHDFRDKTSQKFDFVVHNIGIYRFCFKNKSPYRETIDFDVHVGHFGFHDQHATDEHFAPLIEQISKLEEALYNIQFEQHWLEAQTDRQAIVNDDMSQRAIQKAMFESAALIAASVLQVYLLQRLFERRLRTSRVW